VQKQSELARQRLELGAADRMELLSTRLETLASELAQVDADSAAGQAAGQLEDALQVPFPNLAALADPANASLSHRP
jgi:outer membrane protein TolC